MKLRLTFLIVMICSISVSLLRGDSYQLYFEDANRAYLEGRYDEAAQKYLQLIDKGVASGEVYFNLGNSYYKMNQYGLAILYYEKANRFLQGDEALEKNLKLARLHTIDEIEPIPQLFLKTWWDKVLNIFGLEIYAWITLVVFFIFSVFIAINMVAAVNLRNWIWTLGSIFVFLLILFLNKVYIFESSKFGIILSPKVSIVSEPNISGKEIFILHEGTKVEISRTLDNWYEVKIADGKTGWLKNETVEMI
jgi:tetratricopeptide (TPR) repeat protein